MADAHRLSPSSWNRYETCPRMYWLSRQGLPRKAGMAASLGTAIHASIEDLLNMDISDRPKASMGWLPEVGEAFLKDRWNEEKDAFHATLATVVGKTTAGKRRLTAIEAASTCCCGGSASKGSRTNASLPRSGLGFRSG